MGLDGHSHYIPTDTTVSSFGGYNMREDVFIKCIAALLSSDTYLSDPAIIGRAMKMTNEIFKAINKWNAEGISEPDKRPGVLDRDGLPF